MAALEELQGTHPDLEVPTSAHPFPWWLRLSFAMAALALAGSVAGLLLDTVYARETATWRAEAVGQDLANLVIYPVLLLLAWRARASARALLAWDGLVVYTAYMYAVYAFDVHFGPLFLLYVAVFGMAAWSLGGSLTAIDARKVHASFTGERLAGFVSVFLLVLGGGFAVLWLTEDVPAIIANEPSRSLIASGLLTNPVHVIDLSLFLPATILAGVLLNLARTWGYVLAPVLLSAMAAITLGIGSLMVVHVARDQDGSLVVAGVMGVLALTQTVLCGRYLRNLAPRTGLESVLRDEHVMR